MREWAEFTIEQLGKVITGKTPSKDNPEEWGDAYNFITPSDYGAYNKLALSSIRKLSDTGYFKHKSRLIPANSLLVTCIGSDMGKVVKNVHPSFTNQQINSFIPNENLVNSDFIYYFFKSSESYLKNLGSDGSAVPILNKSTFQQIVIELPPFLEQQAIASVLSALDDKIDLLQRQNQTLEQMAATLFRQWFIEEAKEDWEEVKISTLFEVRDGTHDSPKQVNYGHPLITSKHIHNGQIDFSTAYFISESDYIKINERSLVEQNDILYSMIGTLGLVYIEENQSVNYAIKNIGLFKTSQNLVWKYYVYCWLKSALGIQFIEENKSGSTQEYISLGSLRNLTIKCPKVEKLNKFNIVVKPIFQKINTNKIQIQTLQSQRDTLLPKLISGEVRLKGFGSRVLSLR